MSDYCIVRVVSPPEGAAPGFCGKPRQIYRGQEPFAYIHNLPENIELDQWVKVIWHEDGYYWYAGRVGHRKWMDNETDY